MAATPHGTWGYRAGSSGRVDLVGHLIGLTAYSLVQGTVTINDGDPIVIPANTSFELAVKCMVIDPKIVFAFTESFFVEYVVVD